MSHQEDDVQQFLLRTSVAIGSDHRSGRRPVGIDGGGPPARRAAPPGTVRGGAGEARVVPLPPVVRCPAPPAPAPAGRPIWPGSCTPPPPAGTTSTTSPPKPRSRPARPRTGICSAGWPAADGSQATLDGEEPPSDLLDRVPARVAGEPPRPGGRRRRRGLRPGRPRQPPSWPPRRPAAGRPRVMPDGCGHVLELVRGRACGPDARSRKAASRPRRPGRQRLPRPPPTALGRAASGRARPRCRPRRRQPQRAGRTGRPGRPAQRPPLAGGPRGGRPAGPDGRDRRRGWLRPGRWRPSAARPQRWEAVPSGRSLRQPRARAVRGCRRASRRRPRRPCPGVDAAALAPSRRCASSSG